MPGLADFVVYGGVALLPLAGILYVATSGRAVRESKLLVLAAPVVVFAAMGLQALANRSIWAMFGGILVLCGVILLLGSGFFDGLLAPPKPKLEGHPSKLWVAAGMVFIALGAILIIF